MNKVDSNQREVVRHLRMLGCSVWITSDMGHGGVDFVAGYGGANFLIELKDGNKPPSARKLTPDEHKFHAAWKGQIAVCNSLEEILKIVMP